LHPHPPRRYAALLRAVNLGPHKKVEMGKLRECFQTLGFRDVSTWGNSGNVIFSGPEGREGPLASRLESGVAKTFGFAPQILIRSREELSEVLRTNPFPEMARKDPSHLGVVFLREAAGPAAEGRLRVAPKEREEVRVLGTHAYVTYPDGVGESKLTLPVLERALGTIGTIRNWNTVGKLAALTA
jgi:uncharacterized protein (DUF1697 family)